MVSPRNADKPGSSAVIGAEAFHQYPVYYVRIHGKKIHGATANCHRSHHTHLNVWQKLSARPVCSARSCRDMTRNETLPG